MYVYRPAEQAAWPQQLRNVNAAAIARAAGAQLRLGNQLYVQVVACACIYGARVAGGGARAGEATVFVCWGVRVE